MDYKSARLEQQAQRLGARGATWKGSGRPCTLNFTFDAPKQPPDASLLSEKVLDERHHAEVLRKRDPVPKPVATTQSKETKKRKKPDNPSTSVKEPREMVSKHASSRGSKAPPISEVTYTQPKQNKKRKAKEGDEVILTSDFKPTVEDGERSAKAEKQQVQKKREPTAKSNPNVHDTKIRSRKGTSKELAEFNSTRTERHDASSSDDIGQEENHNPPIEFCEESTRPAKRKRILRNDAALSWNTPVEAIVRRTTIDFGLGLGMKRTREQE